MSLACGLTCSLTCRLTCSLIRALRYILIFILYCKPGASWVLAKLREEIPPYSAVYGIAIIICLAI